MQRLVNAALTFALTAFVTAVSLALIAAAWFMTAHILQVNYRFPLPRWLMFTGAVIMLLM